MAIRRERKCVSHCATSLQARGKSRQKGPVDPHPLNCAQIRAKRYVWFPQHSAPKKQAPRSLPSAATLNASRVGFPIAVSRFPRRRLIDLSVDEFGFNVGQPSQPAEPRCAHVLSSPATLRPAPTIQEIESANRPRFRSVPLWFAARLQRTDADHSAKHHFPQCFRPFLLRGFAPSAPFICSFKGTMPSAAPITFHGPLQN